MVPAHMGQTFDSSHTHVLASNSTVLTATHVESMIKHLKHHGYGETQAAQLVLLMHPDDVEASGMTSWRAGVTVNSVTPKYDFIVSSSAPAYLTTEHVEGTPATARLRGLASAWFLRRRARHPAVFSAAALCGIGRVGRGQQQRQPSSHPRAPESGLPGSPTHFRQWPAKHPRLRRAGPPRLPGPLEPPTPMPNRRPTRAPRGQRILESRAVPTWVIDGWGRTRPR